MVKHDQQDAWEREYRSQQLLSPSNVPHADVVRFVRWLKKDYKKRGERLGLAGMRVLDLGSGTGRNAFYFAEQGADVTGLEFSPTAMAIAKQFAKDSNVQIEYQLQSIGDLYPLPNASVDIVLDVTSSNSLSDAQRKIYLSELARVLKPNGWFFLRALSFEGDAHAKELARRFPGSDPDTYVHPDLGIVEKVFSREALLVLYKPAFLVRELERTQHYTTVAGRTYKRSYWVVYMQRRSEARN